jgi:hypothetical protein
MSRCIATPYFLTNSVTKDATEMSMPRAETVIDSPVLKEAERAFGLLG